MSQITHFFKFADEATAKAALPTYWSASLGTWNWDRSRVDGPISIMVGTGVFVTDPISGAQIETMTPEAGYHMNIGLPALDQSLVALTGFIGARDDSGNIVAGTHPNSPQRVFAGSLA